MRKILDDSALDALFRSARTVNHFQEKPVSRYEVSMGIYMASRRILPYIAAQGPYGFDHLMRDLLAAGQRVQVRKFDGYWLDIGRADDYRQAIDEFAGMKHRFLHE